MKAFTLVELIITTAIIAIMAAVSIPAFSRYGAANDFTQKTSEMKDALTQMYVKTLNPEKGVIAYYVELKGEGESPANTATFYRKTALATEEISSIGLQAGIVLTPAYRGMFCDVVTKKCCSYTDGPFPTSCQAAMDNAELLKLSNPDISKTASIKVFSAPFTITSAITTSASSSESGGGTY